MIKIPLPDGKMLRCEDGIEYENGGSIHIDDPDGNEIVMWDSSEWAEEPELVMGAIFSYAVAPMSQLLPVLKRTMVVDGCWQ